MTPGPHIAIIGAGPTGLDAALAAAAASLPFTLYEAGERVADYVRQWGHVRLFSSWDLDVSPRMRQVLAARGIAVPTGSDCPTGNELIDLVFQPLAEDPTLASSLRLGTRVLAVSRQGLLKNSAIGDPARGDHPFRLLLAAPDGSTHTETAAVVLDCSGSYGNPNATGDGGIPAPGETSLADRIVRSIPDFEAEPQTWTGHRILLVGAGHSAQTAVCQLADLAAEHPGTEILWAVRRPRAEWEVIDNDPLPSRAGLVRRAQSLARGSSQHVRCQTGVVVDSFSAEGNGIHVRLRRTDGSVVEEVVDRVLSLTGFVGDHRLYRQLQVHECYATCGPMKLAASLLADTSGDCLEQTGHGADTLVNPEPNFFILGAKSYGYNSTFLMRAGWQQVDDVFRLLRRLPSVETAAAGLQRSADRHQ